MARKKGSRRASRREEELEEENDESETRPKGFLHGDVKRSIVAVVLVACAILFILGFFEAAGLIGEWSDRASGMALGWGKWIFPFVLLLVAVFLFRRRTSSWSDLVKIGGLSIAFVSLLGLFHSFGDGDLAETAARGHGGGYLGYGLSWLFMTLAGRVGSVVLFLALFVVGLLAAFNFSLHAIRDAITTLFAKTDEDRAREEEARSVDGSTETERAESEPEGVADTNISEDEILEKSPEERGLEGNSEGTEALSIVPSEEERLKAGNIKKIKSIRDIDGSEMLSILEEEPLPSEKTEDKKKTEKEHLTSVPAYFLAGEPSKTSLTSPLSEEDVDEPWDFPPKDLIKHSTDKGSAGDTKRCAEIIRETLANFGVAVTFEMHKTGPAVTQYLFSPASGVKLSRITTLSNDLALALAARSIRIEAPVPGTRNIGIEVPNESLGTVKLRDILESPGFCKRTSPLAVCFGKDVRGEYVIEDLATMPHLLVAGTTRSGKSVFVNSLILSLLYSNAPEDLKLILVDPKRVELSLYNNIPHLVTSVITDTKKVVSALRSMVGEMLRRYEVLEKIGSRDIASYHERYTRGETYEVKLPNGTYRKKPLEKLPYIVIVIDEMADLMMSHGREVEGVIVRLAQMARAVGIHLVLATQRPSVEVITGLIKANIVNRVAFRVAAQIDSRTVLDQGGAEKLLGSGDMLFMSPNSPQPRRMQGPFVSEDEVRAVVDFILTQQRNRRKKKIKAEVSIKTTRPLAAERAVELPESARDDGDLEAIPVGMDNEDMSEYTDDFDEDETEEEGGMIFSLDDADHESGAREDELDPRYEEARTLILTERQASTSFLQRRLGFGYSRAARVMDQLERQGVIGPKDGAKPRTILGSDAGSTPPAEDTDDRQRGG